MQSHQDAIRWLLEEFRNGPSSIAVLEGFVGVGKSSLVRDVAKAWGEKTVTVHATEGITVDDLLLSIAADLDSASFEFSMLGDPSLDLRASLISTLKSNAILIVVDDFELALDEGSLRPRVDIEGLLVDVSLASGSGRVIIITNRTIGRSAWLDDSATRTLPAPSKNDSKEFLERQLAARNRQELVPVDLMDDVCEWLGNNPGAIQAFVSALGDSTLEDLIELDPEGWDLRGQNSSNEFLNELLRLFWAKTLGQLDRAPLRLVQDLSVLRKSFTAEAVQSIFVESGDVSKLKTVLQQRFILDRSAGRFMHLNPVVRQIAGPALRSNDRQWRSAHLRAARHYRRRIQGESDRELVRAGNAFVEARFHLSRAKALDELDDLAAQFRRLSKQAFRNLTLNAPTATTVQEMTPILLAVAASETDSLPDLRFSLVRLLLARNRPGDRQLALNHALIASRESQNKSLWNTLIELLDELESEASLQDTVRRASRVFPSGVASIADSAASRLFARGAQRSALAIIDDVSPAVSPEHAVTLATSKALILDRSGNSAEAIDGLVETYPTLGGSLTSYRLFEEAAFLAVQYEAPEVLNRLKSLAAGKDERARHRATLLRVLKHTLQGKYSAALSESERSLDYPAVASQAAFSALVLGDARLESIARRPLGPTNQSTTMWLRALVNYALRSDTVAEGIARELAATIGAEFTTFGDTMLRFWDHVPAWKGPYPAFYFPSLPPELTGLPFSVHRNSQTGSIYPMISTVQPRWLRADTVPSETSDEVPGLIHIDHYHRGDSIVGDTYNNSGNVGAMGKQATAAVNSQHVSTTVELQVVRDGIDSLIPLADGDPNAITALNSARSAATSGDAEGARHHLRSAGNWLLDKVGDVGVGVTAAMLLKFMGL